MSPQEQEMIDGLISRIRNTKVEDKDTAAEQRLQQGLAGTPDSLYVLAQTVLVQGYGLQQAQTQLEELKKANADLQDQLQRATQAAQQTTNEAPQHSGGGFLSHIFGGGSSQSAPPPSQNTAYQPVNTGAYPSGSYGQQAYPGNYPAPAQTYPAQAYPAPGSGGMFGGGGGFLQGAMQTAAGVAAGEMAFRGIEDLFHGFGGGGERGLAGNPGDRGETVVNNYYDDDRSGGDNGREGDRSSFYNPSDDASRSDSGSDMQFADNSNDQGGGDDNDAGFDDGSSFDDGSNDDLSNM